MEPAHNLLFNQVKAGLGSIDPDQISHKITEVSKDTKFYKKQKERSKLIDEQIDDLKLKLQFASKSDLNLAKIQADSFMSSLEKKRNQDQIIFHADLDAFFASVEIINDPSLKGIPFAVGGSIKHGVVSTSSYEARKFGVRSGMAVFIAVSLCPDLRIVKCSDRYAEFSELVQSEFSFYDPNYISFGLDEASMNMTEYLSRTQQTAVEVAKEIQEKVFNKTKLTISIGIGPTNQLAKIASDINKPNGIYEIPREVDEMMNFIRSLSVRKIPGVGGVTERKLQELNFLTMADILDRRAEVWFLFGNAFSKFILSSALGIQYSTISRDERKSISKEETFEATDDLFILMDKVEKMAEKLALKLQRENMRCKTVTVKFKTHDFQTITHAFSFNENTSKISDVSGAAIKILMEEHQKYHRKLRLIGVRVSNLLYPGQKVQKSINDWISNERKSSSINQQSLLMTENETEEWEQNETEDKENENFDEINSSEITNQNEINNFETNKKDDDDGYSIKKYFKEGYSKDENYESEKSNHSEIKQTSKTDRKSIAKYFKTGNTEDEKINTKQSSSISFESYSYKKTKNNSLGSNDEERKNRLDYHFQCERSLEKSSDYDEDDFNKKDTKYLFNFTSSPKKTEKPKIVKKKRRVNIMKRLIEKYYPETSWESEIKDFNQLSKSVIRNSSFKKPKTTEGTFQIGSFFTTYSPSTE